MSALVSSRSTLESFVGAIESFDRRLRGIDDRSLEAFWAWEAYDEEGVRFGILRTTEEVADAAVEIAARRAAGGAGPTRAERILGRYLVAWRELWSVADRADAALDTPPQEGEWPLRAILDHLVEADLGFLVTIRNGLDHLRAGTPPRLPGSDEQWLALAEVDEPAWRAAFEGSLDDMRAFHRASRDRARYDLYRENLCRCPRPRGHGAASTHPLLAYVLERPADAGPEGHRLAV